MHLSLQTIVSRPKNLQDFSSNPWVSLVSMNFLWLSFNFAAIACGIHIRCRWKHYFGTLVQTQIQPASCKCPQFLFLLNVRTQLWLLLSAYSILIRKSRISVLLTNFTSLVIFFSIMCQKFHSIQILLVIAEFKLKHHNPWKELQKSTPFFVHILLMSSVCADLGQWDHQQSQDILLQL